MEDEYVKMSELIVEGSVSLSVYLLTRDCGTYRRNLLPVFWLWIALSQEPTAIHLLSVLEPISTFMRDLHSLICKEPSDWKLNIFLW